MKLEDRVSFPNGRGQTLAGVLHRPQKKSFAGAILCHGRESNKESEKIVALSRALAKREIAALRFDFSYVGESGGKFEDITYTGEVEDLEAAYDFMRKREFREIAILGSSMGGTVALLFAAKNAEIVAVATVAAPAHPERFTSRLLTPEQVQRWRGTGYTLYHGQRINLSFLHDMEKIDVLEAARKITCPLLIIHGDQDQTVPVAEAHELYELVATSKRLCILQGGDHRFSDPSLLQRVLKESIDWMTAHLLSGGVSSKELGI